MSIYDKVYNEIISNIIKDGISDNDQNVRPKWSDGTPAYTLSLISQQIKLDNSEVPILTTKKVFWKSAIKEMLWIWQMKSNVVQDLRDMGVNIWNQWEMKDGTIGKAYGWQLRNKVRKNPDYFTSKSNQPFFLDQVNYLLWELKSKPASRRIKTTLWCIEDLDEMALTPCVYETHWLVKQNKLHLIVNIRSNDMGIGNPFNIFQYYVLQRMIAQVTNYGLGTLTFNIDDCHIYEKHVKSLKGQLELTQYSAPKLWINPEIKNFYDFSIDDFKLIDYQCGPFIKMEVAE
jgi:thymidylate synthase